MSRNLELESFSSLVKKLGDKDSIKMCYETYAIKLSPNCIAIRHFNTNIIEFYSDGVIVLSNGGYYSSVTKRRMKVITGLNITGSNINCEWKIEGHDYYNGISFHRLHGKLELVPRQPVQA